MSEEELAPSLQEELNRKTVEALDILLKKRNLETINDTQLKLALHSIWSVTSGLIEKEVTQGIANAIDSIPRDAVEKRVYRKGTDFAVLVVDYENYQISAYMKPKPDGTWAAEKSCDFSENENPINMMRAYVMKFHHKVTANGFAEID